MKRSLFVAIVATIALAAAPSLSQAQLGMLKPFQLGIAGGGSLPMSDLSVASNTGFNGTVAMAINVPIIPVGLRIDGAYNQFGSKQAGGAKSRIMSATGNVVLRMPSIGISPYLIGGAGVYMPTATGPGISSTTEKHFGWNAGAGISLPLAVFKTFVEARYNRFSVNGTSMEFVPVTFGIMF